VPFDDGYIYKSTTLEPQIQMTTPTRTQITLSKQFREYKGSETGQKIPQHQTLADIISKTYSTQKSKNKQTSIITLQILLKSNDILTLQMMSMAICFTHTFDRGKMKMIDP